MAHSKKIPIKVMQALKELYESLEPKKDTFAVIEVMRYMALDEVVGLGEGDPDSIRFHNMLWRVCAILKAMSDDEANKTHARIKELENLLAANKAGKS